jgi:phospholipid/cholesterol/gamma-HCH transport system substrate-binding protein
LGINKGIELPQDSRAAIVVQTLLGKRDVSVIAGQNKRLLADGSVIPVSRTTTPIDITQLNDISVRLMNASDAHALNTLLAEVTKVTAGKRAQISELIRGLGDLTGAIDSRRTQLAHLIESLRGLSTTLGERDQTIVSLIDNLNPVLQNLADRQQDIQTLLEATDRGTHDTASLIADNRQVLDQALAGLHRDLAVLNQHQVDLAATVTYLEQAVQGYSSVGYSKGVPNHWANIFVQSLGPIGIDAILGQCGAVDQLIDDLLGTDCSTSPGGSRRGGGGGGLIWGGGGGLIRGGGGHGGGGGRGGGGGDVPSPEPSLPLPTPSLPLPSPSLGLHAADGRGGPSLPGSLTDIFGWALQGTGGGSR